MSPQTFFDNFALLADAPNGIAKLRELILQLAVQGKLVPQDPKAESALILFETIQKERTKLVIPDSFNKETALRRIIENNSLAQGWIQCCLGEISVIRYGKNLPVKNLKPEGYHVFGANGIIGFFDQYLYEEPQLLISCRGAYSGKPNISPSKAFITNNSLVVELPFGGETLRRYLYHALCVADKSKLVTGSAQPQVTINNALILDIALPPLEEQKRIVAKVDELMRLCDELEARQQARRESRVRLNNAMLAPLNNAASLAPEEFEQASARLADNFAALYDSAETVSKLRSTILQLAVQGKLVQQDPQDEPASVLFKIIKFEKARLVKEKIIRNSKPLPPIEQDEEPFEIPNNWVWVRLGDIGDWGAGATPNRSNPHYYGGSIRWFKSGELNDGYISESEERITELALKDCSLRQNQPGDVLIAMYGATIGKLAILETIATTNQAVCACTCFNGMFNEYLFLLLKAFKSHFTGRGAGGAQPNISREKIIHTVTPLPPSQEQKRIVAKVNQLMVLCDELETKLRLMEADSEKLMKAAVRHVLESISQTTTADKEKGQRETVLALSSS